ncbi:MAG: phosphoenolpyruvate--protein phosphotransferase [Rhodospirillales bacterium]|nr:phosphoenolpyruvate--protein phosphotransferase [Rhodospirillales bacterium]
MARRAALSVPRRLLARLREVMAGDAAAEERLGQIVSIIASSLACEVCSIYIRRAGDVLELFATHGLKAQAVHRTRLRLGEGLVGTIADQARSMAFSEAQKHPSFVFRPETGEKIFRSLMGVPILRRGRVLGVVAVQNRTTRTYRDEEIETLETVAMVLAELISGGELVGRDESFPADGNALLPLRLEGVALNPGQAIGTAILHQPQITVHRIVADDPVHEQARLREALAALHGALDTMLADSAVADPGDHRDVLDAYRTIAEDAGWLGRIEEAVASGLTAEAAIEKVHNDIRARMTTATDPYIRERLLDLEDLALRLLQHLVGSDPKAIRQAMPADVVVVARSMGPAQLLDYDVASLRGLVLEEGSPTSHVTIVARALNIPVVGKARDAFTRIVQGDPVIVDGDNAVVYVRPGDDVQSRTLDLMRAREREEEIWQASRDQAATSRDGIDISLNINAGLAMDFGFLKTTGADGIGLYRTEIPFMVRSMPPSIDNQRALYAEAFDRADGKPVTFRTFDVGSDKRLPHWAGPNEDNPAMGWRAIRVGLDRPAMLKNQLRALLDAAGTRSLRIMFPMIAEVSEFDAARALLEREIIRARRRGQALPEKIEVGTMLEVPALIFQLPRLLERVDFVSVGSNDLVQFLFASDRSNAKLAKRYDVLSPLVLRLLGDIVRQCNLADVPLTLCGEAAGRTLEAMALVGLGFRSLSVAPPAVGPVKAMIRSVDIGEIERFVRTLLDATRSSVRENLREFALDHGVNI